jgi:DNA-binding YbaB/EbfC family protein
MFDALKNLSNLGPMLQQAKQMQAKMQEVQARLPSLRATGMAGGGLVTAIAAGNLEIVKLDFAANATTTDPELLADLTRAAVNQALQKVQELVQQEMSGVTGGMDMSAFKGMLGN